MLEVFHSMLLKYAPKRQEFGYTQMNARLQLAALDHNCNVDREHAQVEFPRRGSAPRGTLRYMAVWSKATAQWVVKPVRAPKSFAFKCAIIEAVVQRQQGDRLPIVEPPVDLPRNIAPKPMPSTKEVMVADHRTRFAH